MMGEHHDEKASSSAATTTIMVEENNIITPPKEGAVTSKKNIESSNNSNNNSSNSNTDEDPSKWSKSKKKRMRMKYSKSAKRQRQQQQQQQQGGQPDDVVAATSKHEETLITKIRNNHPAVTSTNDDDDNDAMELKKKKRMKHYTKETDDQVGEEERPAPTISTAVATASTDKVDECQNDDKKQKCDHDNARHNDNTARFAFKVDDTDHCETPLQAYQDIVDILDKLASSMKKTRSSLRIYDPYYCDGGIKKKLASIGFTNVIHNNRDFYEDITEKKIPEFDVLLTNPPYSGAHMGKLLGYCKSITDKKKPFLLLLPHYVYTKDYYQLMLGKKVSSSVFFLVPLGRYNYIPPSWVEAEKGSKALVSGKQNTAPFPSFWYCHTGTEDNNEMICSDWLVDTFGPSGVVRPKHHSKLRYAKCPSDIPREFRGEFDPNNKRANPKARKRAAKMKRESTSRAGSGGR